MTHDAEVVEAVRAALLELIEQASRADWDDGQAWQAGRALANDVNARFGWDGSAALYELECRVYRLVTMNGAVLDDIEGERRRARRQKRAQEQAAAAAHTAPDGP